MNKAWIAYRGQVRSTSGDSEGDLWQAMTILSPKKVYKQPNATLPELSAKELLPADRIPAEPALWDS